MSDLNDKTYRNDFVYEVEVEKRMNIFVSCLLWVRFSQQTLRQEFVSKYFIMLLEKTEG